MQCVRMDTLSELLKELPENERRVMEQRYTLHKTLKATGEALGVSKTRVTQIEAVAVKRLRRILQREA